MTTRSARRTGTRAPQLTTVERLRPFLFAAVVVGVAVLAAGT